MVSTRGVRYKFSEGERVLCYEPDPTKAKVLYDSKVLEVIENKDKRGRRTIEYLIHFQGWNSSWDRCVGEDFVLKDTEENRQLQRDLAEKSQLQLGAYLYRRERKKGSTSGSAGSSAAKRSRHRFSDDGSSSSTQPDEPEGEEAGNGDQEAGDAEQSQADQIKEEIESDTSESSDNEPVRRRPGLPGDHVHVPVGRAHLTIPSILRDRLTFDYHLIVKRNCLTRLPASPCAAQILESFVKWFARAGAWNTPRCRNEPPQKPDLADVSRRLNLVREVADGIRVYFDFIMRGNLLYKPELAQYHHVCGQFLDQQERKMKEELESDGLSQDEYEDEAASAEEDMKSPKIPEYSHLPPDPIQASDALENGGMLDVTHIKQEIKEEPDDIEEDSEMPEEMDAELQEQMHEAMQQEMQERMQQEMQEDEMQHQIKEEIEDQEEYQVELQEGYQEEIHYEIQEDLQDENQEDLQDENQEDIHIEILEVIKLEIEEVIQVVVREELQEEMLDENQEQEKVMIINDKEESAQEEKQETEEIDDKIVPVITEVPVKIKQEKEDPIDAPNSKTVNLKCPKQTLEHPSKDVKILNKVNKEDPQSQASQDSHTNVTADHHSQPSEGHREGLRSQTEGHREGLRSQTSEGHHSRELRSQISEGHSRELRCQASESHPIREGLRSQSMDGLRRMSMESYRSPHSPADDSFANTVRRELHRPNTRSRRRTNSPAMGNKSPAVERGNSSPSVQRGNNSPSVHRGNNSPSVHRGNNSPSVQRGNNSPSVQRGNNSPSVQRGNSSPAVEEFGDRASTDDPHNFVNTIRSQINRPATRGQRRRLNNSPATLPVCEEAHSSNAASATEAPLITETKQEPEIETKSPATRTRTRSFNRKSINSPAANPPAVNSPAANSPAVNSAAVTSPAVNSPAINSPTIDSLTVTTPEEIPIANTTEEHSLVVKIKQEPRDPEKCRPATRSGNVARRLRSRKSAVSQSENEEPQPSTSTAEPRIFEHSSSGSGSSSEEWSKPAEPAPVAPTSTRTPLSLLLDKVSKYEIIPREGTEHLPCRVYGAIHLARLFVRLPDFLNASQMSDFKLKLVIKHIDMFIQYLVEHKEWFGEKFYYCDSMSRST